MKKSTLAATIAIIMALLFVVAAFGQDTGVGEKGKMEVAPREAPPGFEVSVNMGMTIDPGSDGITSMCLYVPVSNWEPVVEPPNSFEMVDRFGNPVTFSKSGDCFTLSDQIGIQYEASGMPATAIWYFGGFTNNIAPTADPGTYNWSAVFYEASDRGTASLSTKQGVLEPTAITLSGTDAGSENSAPYLLGMALFLLSMTALFVLKRRFVLEG